jgi:hypothetical protein
VCDLIALREVVVGDDRLPVHDPNFHTLHTVTHTESSLEKMRLRRCAR